MCQHGLHKEAISTDKAPKGIGPYSQAVRIGGFVYTSGQIPVYPETGELVKGDIELQTEKVLENLKNLLDEAGSGLENVIKTTVFIKDMNEFSRMNEVYSKFFAGTKPARSCVEVSRLPGDVDVEIEAIAFVHD